MHTFLSWDAQRLSDDVERQGLDGDEADLAIVSQKIDQGNRILEAWIVNNGGSVIFMHGDEGYAKVPSDRLDDLPPIREQVSQAWGDNMAVGVGTTLDEASRALKLTLKRSSDIIFYSPEVDKQLSENEEGKKPDVVDKLTAVLNKASPVVPSVSGPASPSGPSIPAANGGGGGGFEGPHQNPPAARPDAPARSASEHSQGEAMGSFLDEHQPPSPSDPNNIEGMFHQVAASAERDNAMAQAQAASAREGGATPPEEIKAKIVKVLSEVKEQAQVLEQIKQAAPDVYKSIMDMVQAMIVMAKELFGGQQSEQPEDGKKVEKAEDDQLGLKLKGPMIPRPPKPAINPAFKYFDVTLRDVEGSIDGQLPSEWFGMPMKRFGEGKSNSRFQFGRNESTYALGKDHVLKLLPHYGKNKAEAYLKRLETLKKLKLSHVVPIIDAGHFGERPPRWGGETTYYTYEILKRAKKLTGSQEEKEEKRGQALRQLNRAGFEHNDIHFGNMMQNTLGKPVLIDLESIQEPKPGMKPKNYNLKDAYTVKIPKARRLKKAVELDAYAPPVPGAIGTAARGSPAGAQISGRLPKQFAGMPIRPTHQQGYQGSSYLLGDNHVLKVQFHRSPDEAQEHLAMVKRLKALKLSHVVPIVAAGHFAKTPQGHYTYEIMERMKPSKGTTQNTYTNMTEQLNDAGWGHTDMHDGNVMRDGEGKARLVDLESFYEKTENDPASDVFQVGSELDKEDMVKLELPMPHAVTHNHLNPKQFVPGSQHDGKGTVKVIHQTEGGKKVEQWRTMRAGKVLSPQDGHAVSALNPKDR